MSTDPTGEEDMKLIPTTGYTIDSVNGWLTMEDEGILINPDNTQYSKYDMEYTVIMKALPSQTTGTKFFSDQQSTPRHPLRRTFPGFTLEYVHATDTQAVRFWNGTGSATYAASVEDLDPNFVKIYAYVHHDTASVSYEVYQCDERGENDPNPVLVESGSYDLITFDNPTNRVSLGGEFAIQNKNGTMDFTVDYVKYVIHGANRFSAYDIAPVGGAPDGKLNFEDYAVLAEEWLLMP
jgi:hypothetical protein